MWYNRSVFQFLLPHFSFPSAGSGRVQFYYPVSRLDRPPTSSNASHGVYRRWRPLKLTSFERLEERNVNDIKKIWEHKDKLSWCHLRKDDQTWPGLPPECTNNGGCKKGRNGRGCGPKPPSCVAQATGQACTTMLSLWTERNQDGNPNSFWTSAILTKTCFYTNI